MNVRQLREALALVPESFNDVPFVVFCTTNGVRVVFDHMDIGYAVTSGQQVVSLNGIQDPNQKGQ